MCVCGEGGREGGGGRVLCQVKVKTQSAKICLNFNFHRGRGVVLCQVKVKTQSAKICLNFNFRRGRGVVLCQVKVKTQSAKICLNFNFGGGWGGAVLRVEHSQNFEPKFQPLQLASASQIVSHTLCVWRLKIAFCPCKSMVQKAFWYHSELITETVIQRFRSYQ